jgi:hypothetical protein
MSAASVGEVSQVLRREGKYPTSIIAADESTTGADADGGANGSPAIASRGIKIARADVIQLSTQLAIMVETGVTLAEALECISLHAHKPKVRALLEDIVRIVHSGTDLSTALARHERSFPRLYVALIRASEKSGMMGKLLTRATNYLRDEQDTVPPRQGRADLPRRDARLRDHDHRLPARLRAPQIHSHLRPEGRRAPDADQDPHEHEQLPRRAPHRIADRAGL